MKKILLFLVLLAGIAHAETKVLCTTLPMTILTKAVVHKVPGYTVSQMLPASLGCPHDYALSPTDMRKLSQADIIVLNGLGMEDFLKKARPRVSKKALVIDSSNDVKGVLVTHGEHDHGAHSHDHGTCSHAKNEHLFAGPATAAGVVQNIAEALAKRDPGSAAKFRVNASRYAEELKRIAAEYAAFGKTIPASRRKIAVQHGIFDYTAHAAGLEVAAYLQAHTGSEPSAAEIRNFIQELKKEKIALILAEQDYPARVTNLISRETGIPVLTLPVYPEQHSSDPEAYLHVFRKNLAKLKAFYRK